MEQALNKSNKLTMDKVRAHGLALAPESHWWLHCGA
jgi:hypothetical protein